MSPRKSTSPAKSKPAKAVAPDARKKPATLADVALLAGVASAFGQTQGAWTATGTMLAAREVNAQVLLSTGKVLAVGGDDGTGTALASAELYTPAKQSWAATGSLATGREAFAAVRLANGKVLVAGGVTTGGGVLASAELFNPTKNTWSPAGSLAVARYAHTATLLADGKVLVTGGCSASTWRAGWPPKCAGEKTSEIHRRRRSPRDATPWL